MEQEAVQRVLVVDDNGDILELTEFFLRHAGFEVETALDGETALGLIQRNPYDVVIADLRLRGGLDGLRVLENHYALYPGKTRILTTAITQWSDGSIPALCEKIKAVYMPKPFHLEQLLAALKAPASQGSEHARARGETERCGPKALGARSKRCG